MHALEWLYSAIYYVNADPDKNPRSFYPNGVPEEVVRYIVWLLFCECMHLVKRGHGFFDDELVESDSGLNWREQRNARR